MSNQIKFQIWKAFDGPVIDSDNYLSPVRRMKPDLNPSANAARLQAHFDSTTALDTQTDTGGGEKQTHVTSPLSTSAPKVAWHSQDKPRSEIICFILNIMCQR